MPQTNEDFAQMDKYKSLVSQVTKNAQGVTQVVFQPTLFLFLGTSSGQVAYRLKKLINRAYGDVPVLRFLWVDLDKDFDPLARPWIDEDTERIELDDFSPADVIKYIDHWPEIKKWWPEGIVTPADIAGAGTPYQMRLAGRLALFRMFNESSRRLSFINRLETDINALFQIQNIRDTTNKSTDKVKYSVESGCKVVMVFSTSGGSGSSLSFDIAYLCRSLLAGKNNKIISVNVLPPVIERAMKQGSNEQKQKSRANTYAWFKEDYYLHENPKWNVKYPGMAALDEVVKPFDYHYVIDIQNQAGFQLSSADDIYSMVAQAIFLDTGSSMSGAMRGFTAIVSTLGEEFEGRPRSFSSLAAASLIYPKERLLDYCSSQMGSDLLSKGLLGALDDHQIWVDTATLLSELRLRDTDLLPDLLNTATIKMQYEASINKSDTVAPALTQIDAQESQNQVARQAGKAKIQKTGADTLVALQKRFDQEISCLAGTKGFSFAEGVFGLLLAKAPIGAIDQSAISLDCFKTRILQQGATENELEAVKTEYKKAYEALKSLDNDMIDKVDQAFDALTGWKNRFRLRKNDCIKVMNRINELTLQLEAQNAARNIYDQMASYASSLQNNLDKAIAVVERSSSELHSSAEALSSVIATKSEGYEFLQEIDVDFKAYYQEKAGAIELKTAFSSMIPAWAQADMATLFGWTNESLKSAAEKYGRNFFVEAIESTSLLSTLKDTADKLGIPPQKLVENELKKLVEYCLPFWNYQKDRGLIGLEGKSILGVEDATSPLIPDSFLKDPQFDIKATGFKDRIDLVRIQHGLPAFILRGMEDYRNVYEEKRKGNDPLHILPGMEDAADVFPEQGAEKRELFAVAIAHNFIINVSQYFYCDFDRGYNSTPKIQPAKEYLLDNSRSKSEEAFTHHDDWYKTIANSIDVIEADMGNKQAIALYEETINHLKEAISKTKGSDNRKQYEKEIKALQSRQRKLGKPG